MRIVAGRHRGRILKTPQDQAIRPTSDKVRQAVFNALQHRGAVVEAVVLDAFCGTGALGLEALSQGAAQAVFMDIAKPSLALATANALMLREGDQSQFLHKDALKPGAKPAEIPLMTLLFLDPPYHKDLVPQAFSALQAGGWLAPDCVIVAEFERGAAGIPGLSADFEKTYGDTSVAIYRM